MDCTLLNGERNMKSFFAAKLDHPLFTMHGIQCLSGNTIKLIAAVCMLLDHTAKIVFVSIIRHILYPLSRAGELSESTVLMISNINHDVLYATPRIFYAYIS